MNGKANPIDVVKFQTKNIKKLTNKINVMPTLKNISMTNIETPTLPSIEATYPITKEKPPIERKIKC